MTRFDFSPLFRSTIGFDRVFDLLDEASRVDRGAVGYPPYDIARTGDDTYAITLAVAGFGEDELNIEARENQLVVAGKRDDGQAGETGYLHRGIAGRDFRRVFQLAEHLKVTGARLDNGLLHIELERELPQALRPRRIEIQTKPLAKIAAKAKKLVEGVKNAA